MQEESQQLRKLEELSVALREAIAIESSPAALARFYELLREVEAAIRSILESRF